jgi:hypothetical protein
MDFLDKKSFDQALSLLKEPLGKVSLIKVRWLKVSLAEIL